MRSKLLLSFFLLTASSFSYCNAYPTFKESSIDEQKLMCFPQSANPGLYLHSSVLDHIDRKEVHSIFEIGSRDALDAIRLSLFYQCHVYAFECNPDCVTLCRLNAKLTPNVTVVDRAVWDKSGVVDFYPIVAVEGKGFDPGSSSCFKLLPKTDYCQTKIAVPAIRLDEWMGEKGMKGVDLICMSTQGASLKVLQGMGDTIKNTKYIVTRCEVDRIYEGECVLPELTAYLKSQGFERVSTELPYDYMFVNQKYLKAPVQVAGKSQHGITYEYTPGRLGDKLLGYSHTRYLSYLTGIQFLSRPFPYSQFFSIEYESVPMESKVKDYSQTFHVKSADSLTEFFRMIQDPKTPPTLFFVDYFPSDISEWDWPYTWWTSALIVPWKDEKFSAYLKKSLQPKIDVPDFTVKGRLNVADHIRYSSGGDNEEARKSFPLKVPKLDYHERQIRRVYEFNGRKPMHVFIFTDAKKPLEFLEDIKKRFTSEDILFNVQVLEKPDVNNVVQDFFAMQKFNVLITTQSNLSMMASRIADFDMVISPIHVIGEYPDCQIDRVQLVSRKSEWFPYELNTILRENIPGTGPKQQR